MRIRRAPTRQEIAARAYEIHQQHGATQGRALEDWVQAEAELRAAEGAAETADVSRRRKRPQGGKRPQGRAGDGKPRKAVGKQRGRRTR